MQNLRTQYDRMDVGITRLLSHYSIAVLRVGLGSVFFWFGVLKFFSDLSPAQALAIRTLDALTFGLVPAELSVMLLATLECVIGLGLITGRFMRLTLLLLVFHMVGTTLPLLLFPGDVFNYIPYAPTLEGQYIIKNVVLVGAALVIGSTVRGGRIVANPEDEILDNHHASGDQPVRA